MPVTFQSSKSQPKATSYANPMPTYPVGAATCLAPSNAGSPATVATASDTTITFASAYSRIQVQNNSNAIMYYFWDAAAGTGTFQLLTGQTLFFDTSSALHVYQNSGASVNINSGTVGFVFCAWSAPAL